MEVLIVMCLITVLAVVSLPMLTRANGQARSTACQANLATLAQHLERFEVSTGHLPTLMNRESDTLDVPTLDRLFVWPHQDRALFHCPGDDRGVYDRSGSSYRWYTFWDNQPLVADGDTPRSPVVSDKAPFHTDQRYSYNALFLAGGDANNARARLAVSPYAMPE